MPDKVGILAYGSLIGDPGPEIEPHMIRRIPCNTPFKVELHARVGHGRAVRASYPMTVARTSQRKSL